MAGCKPNMVFNPILILTFAVFCRPAFAQDLSTIGKPTPASQRVGKIGWVGIEPIGFTESPTGGLRGGYYVSPDLSAELSLANSEIDTGRQKASKDLLEIKTKFFMGNSLYVDGGIGIENWKIETKISDIASTGSVQSFGASFHLGNQWHWSQFILGVDWIGYALLASAVKLSQPPGVGDEAFKAEKKNVTGKYTGNRVHFARLFLGWAF